VIGTIAAKRKSGTFSRTNIRNNWDLSALSASSVVQALQNIYGINPKRLTAAGRGEYPVAGNDTAEGKARNRRNEIIITPKLDQFMDLIDQAPGSSSSDTIANKDVKK
jgi:chemotaxis protein MotB